MELGRGAEGILERNRTAKGWGRYLGSGGGERILVASGNERWGRADY